MNKIMMWMAALMVWGVASGAWAETYAPKVPVTSSTSAMGRVVIQSAKVPDSSVVGIPAYPGALVIQTREAGAMQASDGKPYLPYIKLLSSDTVDKVVKWYRERLSGWYYQKVSIFSMAESHRFWKEKGDYGMMDMDAMGTVPNVIVSAGKQHADDYPPAEAMIEVTYQPRTGK